MPSSRSDSRPRAIASAKRFRWVRLRTCTAVASARSIAVAHSPLIVRYSSSASSSRPRLYRAACRPVCTSTSVAVSSGSISRSAAASSAFTSAWSPISAAWSAARRSSPTTTRRSAASSTASTTGRYCSAATANSSGTAASRRAMASCRARRRRGSSPRKDRLADAVVAEPHRLMRPGLRHQQALVEGGRQRLLHHARRFAGGGLQQAQLGPPAQTRHRLHQPPATAPAGPRPAPPAARPPRSGPGGRAPPPRPTATRRPSRPARPSRRSALSSSTVSYGLPRRVRVDHLGQARRRGRVHVQHLGDHGDEAGRRQVVQPQVPHSGLFPPPGQRRRQRMRGVDVVVAVGAHQQQALDRLLAQHQVDEAERGAPGPLQVVDEHHHRPFPRGDRPQDLHTRCAAPAPARSADPPDRAAPPAAPRTPAPPRSADPRSGRAPAGSARGPRPARPPARPAAADPARETPDRPRRTPDPAGTGRTCRPRTSRPCRSPPAAARRPAPSCPPPAPR